jgi:hypothetical protein
MHRPTEREQGGARLGLRRSAGRRAVVRDAIEGMLQADQGGPPQPTAEHDEMMIVGGHAVFPEGITDQNGGSPTSIS